MSAPRPGLSLRDSLIRSFNLTVVALLVVGGAGFATAALTPGAGPLDRGADAGVLALGLLGTVWYLSGSRHRLSAVPGLLAIIAFTLQVSRVVIVHEDPFAPGNHYGELVFTVMVIAVALWQYRKTQRLVDEDLRRLAHLGALDHRPPLNRASRAAAAQQPAVVPVSEPTPAAEGLAATP